MASQQNLPLLFLLLLFVSAPQAAAATIAAQVCIIGSGIAGSSVSHFLRKYAPDTFKDILIFERNGVVGGRMATVTIGGDTFEAGACVIHPKNLHALEFASMLGLRHKPDPTPDYSSWLGIWDGSEFVFQTLPPPTESSSAVYRMMYYVLNPLRLFWRYGVSLLRMNNFTQYALNKFLLYYKSLESRPVFDSVEEMLRWSGLYNLTQRTLQEELADANLSSLIISEIITVITRINYGQDVSISGLAGAISLAGSQDGLWSVDGGNWQIPAGLIRHSNATLKLHEEVTSVLVSGQHYELSTTKGNNYSCGVTIFATPLDELDISFSPPISIPSRKMQHTYATFVRGLLNPEYFGLKSASEIPGLVGTLEIPEIPFSSISILKKYSENDITYKVFSRAPLKNNILDRIFSSRKETVEINWAAYPHYTAPENFAPFILDDKHLYYVNSFESGASAIETGAVAAENVARLILSRLNAETSKVSNIMNVPSDQDNLHLDL